jgi:4-hydroxybenzoate polyprenyltransferase
VLSAGSVIGQTWEMYKAHWRHLIPIAFVVYVLISLFALLLAVLLGWVGAVLGALIGLAGVFWLQGALVMAIDDVRDGRADLSVRETLNRVLPRLNTLTFAGLLAALGITIGFLLLIVPGLILITLWLLIVPAIMLEHRGVFESFGRSRQLVSGHGWNVFGVIVLTVAILIAVNIGLSLVEAAFDTSWLNLLLDIASQTVTAPFLALAWTITYYELRAIKEPTPAVAA